MLDRGYAYRRGEIAAVANTILRAEEFLVENADQWRARMSSDGEL